MAFLHLEQYLCVIVHIYVYVSMHDCFLGGVNMVVFLNREILYQRGCFVKRSAITNSYIATLHSP